MQLIARQGMSTNFDVFFSFSTSETIPCPNSLGKSQPLSTKMDYCRLSDATLLTGRKHWRL